MKNANLKYLKSFQSPTEVLYLVFEYLADFFHE